jgi:hypothetical protein
MFFLIVVLIVMFLGYFFPTFLFFSILGIIGIALLFFRETERPGPPSFDENGPPCEDELKNYYGYIDWTEIYGDMDSDDMRDD